VSVEKELVKRIKDLDREESMLRHRAERHRASADDDDRDAERCATDRRRYEFIVKELTGELPKEIKIAHAANEITVPVNKKKKPAVIGQL
jgi:hypothetical protein